jgi:hypothetical protein
MAIGTACAYFTAEVRVFWIHEGFVSVHQILTSAALQLRLLPAADLYCACSW